MILLGLALTATSCGAPVPTATGDAQEPSSTSSAQEESSTTQTPETDGTSVTTWQPTTTVTAPVGGEVTSVTVVPWIPIDSDVCPNFVEEVETGGVVIGGESGEVQIAQDQLLGDIESAQEYGSLYPEEFAMMRYANTPRVRVVAAFTQNIEFHCTNLRTLLEHPDDFEIIYAARTHQQLSAIQDEIHRDFLSNLSSSGSGNADNVVFVTLRGADAVKVAEEILGRYGSAVMISIGSLSYPPDPASETEHCPFDYKETSPDYLSLTVELDSSHVVSGETFGGSLIIRNVSQVTQIVESGEPQLMSVFGQDSLVRMAHFSGPVAGVGIGADLAPGESIDIDLIGSTLSCSLIYGYALAAGTYDVRASVRLNNFIFLSEPTTIEVVEP